MPVQIRRRLRLGHLCTQPTLQFCVCDSMAETVHLGLPQEAVVPDSTPRPERKSLNAQATSNVWFVMWALQGEDGALVMNRSADV